MEIDILRKRMQNKIKTRNNNIEIIKIINDESELKQTDFKYKDIGKHIDNNIKQINVKRLINISEQTNVKHKNSHSDKFEKILNDIGYELLTPYIKSYEKVNVKCINGHIWNVQPRAINNGNRCPHCSKKVKYTINNIKQTALNNNLKCLETKYINNSVVMNFQCMICSKKIKKKATYIMQGFKCCENNNDKISKRRLTIYQLNEIVKERGGKLLSKERINRNDKLEWQCEQGHTWFANIDSVISNKRWCPQCQLSYGENITRQIFEQLLNVEFPKIKPDWLINDNGNKLELDGYNKEIKIAFEYNGVQHYEINNRFHHNEQSLKKQQRHDEIKRTLCDEHNILLIEISHNIKHSNLINYIKQKLINYNIKINQNDIIINKEELYKNAKHNIYKKRVEQLGYKLLSKYVGISTDVTLECSQGHIFNIQARSIFRNKGCPVCSGYRIKSITELRNKALNFGFEIIDNEYNPSKRIRCKCKDCGYVIKLRHADIIRGDVKCESCIAKDNFIKYISNLNYKLISNFERNNKSVDVQCNNGHISIVTPYKFMQGLQRCKFCIEEKINNEFIN